MTVIHALTSLTNRCRRSWGRGRWFGPMHQCDRFPHVFGPCRCSCGEELGPTENVAYVTSSEDS